MPLTPDVVFEAETLVYVDKGELYLMVGDQAYQTSVTAVSEVVWQTLAIGRVVAYDVKKLYHELDNLGVQVRFSEVWDVRQAAFLLDPLARDRSLMALVGDFSEDDKPARQLARLSASYQSQQQNFTTNETLAKIARDFDFPVIWPQIGRAHV